MTHSTTQTSRFFQLPLETQTLVLEYVIASGNLQSRCVCKDWLPQINVAICLQWVRVKELHPQGPIDPSFMLTKVQYSLPPTTSRLLLFRALNEQWKLRGISIPSGEVGISLDHFADLQAKMALHCADKNLMCMWSRIWPLVKLYVNELADCKSVRAWIASPDTQHIRSSIHGINLSDLGIRFIPPEITAFPNLYSINLSENHIDVLPGFIGDLKELYELSLRNNDITDLPEKFSQWTHIDSIDLRDNPLTEHAKYLVDTWRGALDVEMQEGNVFN